jgi:membrane carboxypeptidase/penicillin-binding protein
VHDGVGRYARSYHVNNGAMLVMNPHTGEVLAMVGSADYSNTEIGGQVNYTLAPRQPGSSFKPYTYVTALMNGWTPASPLEDRNGAHAFPGYPVHDWDGKELGTITLRQSLQQSRNISSVHLFKDVGVQKVLALATSLGISTKLEPTLPTTLGASEVRMIDHLSGYSAFANGGHLVKSISVLEVRDAAGKCRRPSAAGGRHLLADRHPQGRRSTLDGHSGGCQVGHDHGLQGCLVHRLQHRPGGGRLDGADGDPALAA